MDRKKQADVCAEMKTDQEKHIDAINALIPDAERIANQLVPEAAGSQRSEYCAVWTRVFTRQMNVMASAAGLRVL